MNKSKLRLASFFVTICGLVGVSLLVSDIKVSNGRVAIGWVSAKSLPISDIVGKKTTSLGAVSIYYMGIPNIGALRIRIEQTHWERVDGERRK